MIHCREFFELLQQSGFRFFTGVPDSLLKDLCAYITDNAPPERHIIAANEGASVALAAGHYLASGEPGVVYLQNSGLGNMVNPLASLVDAEVYAIPMLLMVGWRGEPGVKDEPQHVKQGKITLELVKTLGIPVEILPDSLDPAREVMDRAQTHIRENGAPYCVIIRKGTFEPYAIQNRRPDEYQLTREAAIISILDALPDDAVVVSTTGMTSREVFEHRARNNQSHGRDFLTVGCMGHASQIALGIALEKPQRQVVCLDGDGALIMHMGSLAIIGSQRPKNLKHLVLNNGAHDSVGGQPTVGFEMDIPAIARACGYLETWRADDAGMLSNALAKLIASVGPSLLEVRVNKGARKDLGRPTKTPVQNKQDFMTHLSSR